MPGHGLAADMLLNQLRVHRYSLSQKQAAPFRQAVDAAFSKGSASLVEQHNNILDMEAKKAAIAISRGAVPPGMASKYDGKVKQCAPVLFSRVSHKAAVIDASSCQPAVERSPSPESLGRMCSYNEFKDALEAFATAWGEAMPELKARPAHPLGEAACIAVLPRPADGGSAAHSLWDTDQEAAFYSRLPELAALVPALALASGAGEETTDSDTKDAEAAGVLKPEELDTIDGGGDTQGVLDTQDPNYDALRGILDVLPTCGSVEQADKLALDFCFIQTKGVRHTRCTLVCPCTKQRQDLQMRWPAAQGRPGSRSSQSVGRCAGKRKSLARALANLFKLPLQLLPFYARITATLSHHFPDMGTAVAKACIAAYRGSLRQKSTAARTLEPRIRAARYLCELAKFGVVDAGAHLLLFLTLVTAARPQSTQQWLQGCA